MSEIDLRQIDLNYLKAFEAIERTRNVSRAAELLGIGQSATSHALARLRVLCRDELFVRGPGGMEPTVYAKQIIGPVRAALSQIDRVMRGATTFDPAANRRLTVGTSDIAAAALMPQLVPILKKMAPGLSLVLVHVDRSNARTLLDDHMIDIAVGLLPEADDWHRRQVLYQEPHVCVFAQKQIKIKIPISLDDYVAHDHLMVSLRGHPHGWVDDVLEGLGRKRHIGVCCPYFSLAAYILPSAPLIATLPQWFAFRCAAISNLTVSELPFKAPHVSVSMLWHTREDNDLALDTLRAAILEAVAKRPTK